MESVAAREDQQEEHEQLEMFEGVPVSRRIFALRSGELGTPHHLSPGQIVRGRFTGQVAQVHFDRKTKKDMTGGDVPEWRRKVWVEALVVELEIEDGA